MNLSLLRTFEICKKLLTVIKNGRKKTKVLNNVKPLNLVRFEEQINQKD